MRMSEVQHVFLVGAKSLGAYGGYETFVNKLTELNAGNPDIKYHVACKANGDGHMDESLLTGVKRLSEKEFEYQGARCFKIHVPNIGPAQALYYDIAALHESCQYIRVHRISHPIVYVMACRIGPVTRHFAHLIHQLGGKLFLNPDGHEWMRAKWSKPVRKYWKLSEELMVKHADKIVCDSTTIEKYIHASYDEQPGFRQKPQTTFIAYGADTTPSKLSDDDDQYVEWMEKWGIAPDNYYLVVGRFVPENNYETMIREFMESKTNKDFVIITNVNDKFLDELQSRLQFKKDKRVKFVGTVYNQELLKKIRQEAFAYFHGHEVGGTNPSLLEALGSTNLNLLLDVGFNREVARNSALYWTKQSGNLAKLINEADSLDDQTIHEMSERAKARIAQAYSWKFISDEYTNLFLNAFNNKI